eukprot:SAG11_NODE_8913_length_963_cov_1.437500_2_plen_82_part_00
MQMQPTSAKDADPNRTNAKTSRKNAKANCARWNQLPQHVDLTEIDDDPERHALRKEQVFQKNPGGTMPAAPSKPIAGAHNL